LAWERREKERERTHKHTHTLDAHFAQPVASSSPSFAVRRQREEREERERGEGGDADRHDVRLSVRPSTSRRRRPGRTANRKKRKFTEITV